MVKLNGCIFTEDDELLEKYYSIQNKTSNSTKKEFGFKPIYNKKILKAKIRSFGNEATDFHDKEMAKVGSNYTCLALILIDFVFKKDKYYCLQVLLKECEYIEKEKSDYTYY